MTDETDVQAVARLLESGLQDKCADDIASALCNLEDGTCDAVELIPLLDRVVAAKVHFYYFDDNSSGGMPRASGRPFSFEQPAANAIANIRANRRLESASPLARLLKSPATAKIQSALVQLADGNCTDETLIPILEKIARKDKYTMYSYYSGYGEEGKLGAGARKAIERIRANIAAA